MWSNGSTQQDIAGLSSGVYTVTVTGANNCPAVLSVPLLTVGTKEANAQMKVQLQPNPVHDRLMVYVENVQGALVTLRLTDLNGRVLDQKSGSNSEFFFDTSILSEGLYVLWLRTSLGERAFKVVIAR